MKRTKSSISLCNLAMSIKQSILKTTKPRQFIPLKTNASTVHLPLHRITQLEQAIAKTKGSVRDYTQQLRRYDQICLELHGLEDALRERKEKMWRWREGRCMLEEDVQSRRANTENSLAELEYHQELISTYLNQYEVEGAEVLMVTGRELENAQLTHQIINQEKERRELQDRFQHWKEESAYELNQHKSALRLKSLRMDLIKCEEQCDQYCMENGLRKIREVLCSYLKCESVRESELSEGVEGYICKMGLFERVQQFIKERLAREECFEVSPLNQYLSILRKMTGEKQRENTTVSKYQLQLKGMEDNLLELRKKMRENETKIAQGKQRLQLIFANESVAFIEYCRTKNKNVYDIKQIRNELKQLKAQQDLRKKQVENSIRAKDKLQKYLDQVHRNEEQEKKLQQKRLTEVRGKLEEAKKDVDQIRKKVERVQKKKKDAEEFISDTVSKWQQRDDHKKELKELQKSFKPMYQNQFQSISFKQLNASRSGVSLHGRLVLSDKNGKTNLKSTAANNQKKNQTPYINTPQQYMRNTELLQSSKQSSKQSIKQSNKQSNYRIADKERVSICNLLISRFHR